MKKYLTILALLMSFSAFAQYPSWVNRIKYTPILKGNYNPNDSLPKNNRLCALYLDTTKALIWGLNPSKSDWVLERAIEEEVITPSASGSFTLTRNYTIVNSNYDITLNIPNDDYFDNFTIVRTDGSTGVFYVTTNNSSPDLQTWEGGIDYGVMWNPNISAFSYLKLNGIYYIENIEKAIFGLADNEVTTAKIDNAAVETAKIANNAIVEAKLADACVSSAKVASNAITAAKIPDAELGLEKLNGSGAGSGQVVYWDGGAWAPRTLVKSDISGMQAELDAKQNSITLTTTGTSGAATFSSGVLNIPQYGGGGGLTNWTEAFSTSTQNNSSFTATNAGQSNIIAVVSPKGTGGFGLTVPTGTITGGNALGNYAVSLQIQRGAASQTATGANSFVAGTSCTASGTTSIAMGNSSAATNTNTVALGSSSTASASGAVTLGSGCLSSGTNSLTTGNSCTASAQHAIAQGYQSTAASPFSVAVGSQANATNVGEWAKSSGGLSNAIGTSQVAINTPFRVITGTSQTELFLDGSSSRLIMPANRSYNSTIQLSVIVKTVGNGTCVVGDSYYYYFNHRAKRVTNTTTDRGLTSLITATGDASLDSGVVSILANDTTDAIEFKYTPPSTAGSTTVIHVNATVISNVIGY